MTKDLKEKAISLKGKQYVLVSDRVIYFNENFENGSIITELVSDPKEDVITIKATVTPDCEKPERKFTGYAQEVIGTSFINKTSAMENCETSAVGRALAMIGIGVIDSIASVDEINKAGQREIVNEKLGTCEKCGAPNKMSKAGNKYCSARCWLDKEKQIEKVLEECKNAPDTSEPLDF